MSAGLRLRKFSPIDREYPIYEILDEEPLVDVGVRDDGVYELAIHAAASGKVLPLRELKALIEEAESLLAAEMSG